jgi:hypothetical protein
VIILGRSQTVGALARRVQSETDVSHFAQEQPRVNVNSNL